MAKYVADGNKLKPGALPDNAYDRASNPSFFTHQKTPNFVIFGDLTGDVGFFYGSSASFAELDLNLSGTGQITCSKNSKQISGSGTAFTTELVVGDKIQITSQSVSQVRIIDSIKNDTSMSVTANVTLENIDNSGFSQSLVERKRSFMSKNYEFYGTPTTGDKMLIHPSAVSGSSADDGSNIVFIYKSGLAGPPRRF